MKRLSGPVIHSGRTLPFQVAVSAWIDLLGYGKMISEAQFNPLHENSSAALKRLRTFHEHVAQGSKRSFPTLVINDGAVAYRDLSLRARSVTHEFVVNSWKVFKAIQEAEQTAGHPGARMIIAAGFRMRGRRAGMDQSAGHFRDLMERFQNRQISATQAIAEASRIHRTFDVVPQLQANFAFTKAYVADSDGKAGGLADPQCFVDLCLFDDPPPPWIELGQSVDWRNQRLGMATTFAPIRDIPSWKHIKGGPIGIRDGLQVARHLTGDQNILRALQKLPRQSHRS
jgi:hypothetical protein